MISTYTVPQQKRFRQTFGLTVGLLYLVCYTVILIYSICFTAVTITTPVLLFVININDYKSHDFR